MVELKKQGALLVVLGFVTLLLAGPPLALVVFATYQRGLGLNQETVVLALTALALVAVFWHWISEGKKIANKEPNAEPVKFFSFESFKYRLLGASLLIVAILIAAIYVEYIEPHFINR